MVQASANAYTQCDRYQRTCAMIQLPAKQTYVVDIFRVAGGQRHQYGLNGNGKLIDPPETQQPLDRRIKWLDNLRSRRPGPFTATWECQDADGLAVLNPIDRLIVADAPGWRSDRGSELNAAPIQQILAERSGADRQLTSQFVSVIAPYERPESPVRTSVLIGKRRSNGVRRDRSAN